MQANILEILEHSGTFWNLLEPSGSLEPSEFQLDYGQTDGQTYISTSRAAPSQLKMVFCF